MAKQVLDGVLMKNGDTGVFSVYATDGLDDIIYEKGDLLPPDVISSGWGIDANGLAVNTPAGQTVKKYEVTAGEKIYLVANSYYQFQNNVSIPTWNNTYIIGGTQSTFDGVLTVPAGASWLMVNIPNSSDVTGGVYEQVSKIDANREKIEAIENDLYKTEAKDVDHTPELTNLCYTTNGGVGTVVNMIGVSETQFKSVVLPCITGDAFKITGTGGNAYRLWCFTDTEYKILSVAGSYVTATDETKTAQSDGYFIYQITTASPYKVVQVDATVKEFIGDYLELFTSFGMFQSVAGVGDSYTEGDMVKANNTWVTRAGVNYLSVISKRNGVTVKNYGSGGATTKTYLTRQAFTEALADTPSDLYILALGQNDVNVGTTKGTVSDIHEDYTENPDTFYGNYGRIISQLKAHAPNARFIIMGSWVKGTAGNGVAYQSYNDAIEEIGAHFGIPYIDPFDDPFFDSTLYNNMSHGHPVAMGYAGMGLAMERLLNKCVIENQSYFKYALLG